MAPTLQVHDHQPGQSWSGIARRMEGRRRSRRHRLRAWQCDQLTTRVNCPFWPIPGRMASNGVADRACPVAPQGDELKRRGCGTALRRPDCPHHKRSTVARQRIAVVRAIRNALERRGFSRSRNAYVCRTLAGGAAARPFMTHSNAMDIDLYLRIAPDTLPQSDASSVVSTRSSN